MYANFVNPFRPGDAMTSMTYVQRVEQHPNGEPACQPVREKYEAGRFHTIARVLATSGLGMSCLHGDVVLAL